MPASKTLGERVKHAWETWDIRVLILTSLLIQVLLTIFAPCRKRSSSGLLILSMWMLYLAADSIAIFTIGLISNSQEGSSQQEGSSSLQNADLLPFWAPFLLLHLGGPDTITALALEDNELWRRHALQFATQVIVTLYIFGLSVRKKHYQLWIPTVLIFVDGCIKYIERTCALYFASMDTFRDSQREKPEPGPNYAKLMEEYYSASSAYIPTKIQGKDGPSDGNNTGLFQGDRHRGNNFGNNTMSADLPWGQIKETDQMVQEAYYFYKKFRGLLADTFLSLKDRDESRDIFLRNPAPEAFRIVEIELNFIYDVFYTKVFLLHRKRGYARAFAFALVIVSLLLFCFMYMSKYQSLDVGVTLALLGGAIALDMLALLMFVLSDWWIIINSWDIRPKLLKSLSMWLLTRLRWARNLCRGRWSQSISKYNLLRCCLKEFPSFCKYRRIKDVLIKCLYIDSDPVDERLLEFIVKELQKKAELVTSTEANKEVCSARGNLVFQDDYFLISEYLRPWTLEVDYDESLLTWQLATEICHLNEQVHDERATSCSSNEEEERYHKFSKDISDYMSYLLLRQQSLVSPVVGISDIRFDDTCAEVHKFTDKRLGGWIQDACAKVKEFMYKILKLQCLLANNKSRDMREENILKQFCGKVLQVKTDVRPIVAKGDKSKSVLFDACRLAKQLRMFGGKQWEVTSKVWMELLCYAAIRCSPRSHVAQLSKGGELITLVWLLMAHLGLGDRFRQNRGFGWTKLIIDK